ncbi:nitroreductase family protein [Candidatus Latescibacterota bacterium]
MIEQQHNPRISSVKVDTVFTDRWSPRSFKEEPVPAHIVETLFEAARWAPSSSNEQPWLFFYAVKEDDRARYSATLKDANREWAARAPLLIYVAARRSFKGNDQENNHRRFDAGAAWMSLALQARSLGLYTHAMAGFNRAEAYEMLGLPEKEYDLIAAVAVGYRGDASDLSEFQAGREHPNDRKPLSEVRCEGRFKQENHVSFR